ncbi:hypothetical protein LOK49_LG12G00900 [Camellia lanceoleosa]|uniref:Uncharacterized protein n=2 Tax=Camellia lanceoleosa TaxID=1840588 RepID=A0ACC0FT28_9ERIC|nr:hypothetical protein LOK49_LG12G00944 [Camellia lanceoleosa]KAI7991993.1 hypothetical protein LOK49_LG12G00900 [Camellia lanceoleosa]
MGSTSTETQRQQLMKLQAEMQVCLNGPPTLVLISTKQNYQPEKCKQPQDLISTEQQKAGLSPSHNSSLQAFRILLFNINFIEFGMDA